MNNLLSYLITIKSASVRHWIALCLPIFLPTKMSVCLSACLPVFLPFYMPVCLPTFLPSFPPSFRQSALLPAFLPVRLLFFLSAFMPFYLCVCSSTFLPSVCLSVCNMPECVSFYYHSLWLSVRLSVCPEVHPSVQSPIDLFVFFLHLFIVSFSQKNGSSQCQK